MAFFDDPQPTSPNETRLSWGSNGALVIRQWNGQTWNSWTVNGDVLQQGNILPDVKARLDSSGYWDWVKSNPPPGGTSSSTSNNNSGSTSSGDVPSWVPASERQWYQDLNAGWKQGHSSDIPQDQYDYFTGRRDAEAKDGNARDNAYWAMRASGLHEDAPGSSSSNPFGPQGQYQFTPFEAPAPFTFRGFDAPTLEEALNDPGYKFALQQGQKALEASAAAKGTLLTGNTGKALEDYGQAAATQQYNNVYNRDFNTWQGNYNAAKSAYDANVAGAQNAWSMNNAVALAAWQANNGQYNTTLGNLFNLASFGQSASGVPQNSTSSYAPTGSAGLTPSLSPSSLTPQQTGLTSLPNYLSPFTRVGAATR